MPSRRQFVRFLPAAGVATLALGSGRASAAMVDENGSQARALGYVADATRADRSRYKQYAPGQRCTNCAYYQGGGAPAGGCSLFPRQQVAGAGWCSAWTKKA